MKIFTNGRNGRKAKLDASINEVIEANASTLADLLAKANANFGVRGFQLPEIDTNLDRDGWLTIMISGMRPKMTYVEGELVEKISGWNYGNFAANQIDNQPTYSWLLTVQMIKFIVWLVRRGHKKIRLINGSQVGPDLCWCRASINAWLLFRRNGELSAEDAEAFSKLAINQSDIASEAGKYAGEADIQIVMAIPHTRFSDSICKEFDKEARSLQDYPVVDNPVNFYSLCTKFVQKYGYFPRDLLHANYSYAVGVDGLPLIGSYEYRNRWMVAQSDLGIAIHDGSRGGTKNAIRDLKAVGKPTIIVHPDDAQYHFFELAKAAFEDLNI